MVQRINVPEALRGYSRKILSDYRETAAALEGLAFERGGPREATVRKFLAEHLPKRYGVGEGTVIDSRGHQSQQGDVVIYDALFSPTLTTSGSPMWPFELVYAMVEVKSKLTRTMLADAVTKIATFKRLVRCDVIPGSYQPAIGVLIAHETDPACTPDSDAFREAMSAVPVNEMIDCYCIIDGHAGFRGAEVDGQRIIALDGDKLLRVDNGDGALASFLLVLVSIMNTISLGNPSLLPYLQYLLPSE